ncbi:MAG: DUF4419 domain-containing protein [Planctomycetes bacterium]|nr:DUF4419 domain-containing protein [Planctomycetota bacterium]
MSTRTARPGITFAVDDVEPAKTALSLEPTYQAVKRFFEKPVESCSDYSGEVVWVVKYHPLFWAVHTAFNEHRPLVFSPDMIWLTIVQGLAQHVRNHQDDLWHHFAGADLTPVLCVERDDIVKGSPENLWEEMVSELADQVAMYLPEIREQLVPTFSTTGPRERMAFELALLEVVLPFYLYQFASICGIPQVTLEGTADDWKLLQDRVRYLRRFEMDWWLDPLDDVCEGFVLAAEQKPDLNHWRGMYRKDAACGGTEFDGWIGHLVPYTRGELSNCFDQRNPLLAGGGERIRLAALPTPLSRVPFRYVKRGNASRNYRMEFLSGKVAVEQDPESLALRPKIGWAVRETSAMERLETEFVTIRAPLSESAIVYQYQRLTNLPRPPHALKQFYAECNGGTVGTLEGQPAYDFLPMELIEPIPVKVPEDQVRGEYSVRAHLVPFCQMADGSMAALVLGYGYDHHGGVLVMPREQVWGKQLPLVADRFESFLEQSFDSPDQPYTALPGFEPTLIDVWR